MFLGACSRTASNTSSASHVPKNTMLLYMRSRRRASLGRVDEAKQDLEGIEKMGLAELPVCIAKTHLSISDTKTVLGKPAPFELTVTGLRPAAGAGFVVDDAVIASLHAQLRAAAFDDPGEDDDAEEQEEFGR